MLNAGFKEGEDQARKPRHNAGKKGHTEQEPDKQQSEVHNMQLTQRNNGQVPYPGQDSLGIPSSLPGFFTRGCFLSAPRAFREENPTTIYPKAASKACIFSRPSKGRECQAALRLMHMDVA